MRRIAYMFRAAFVLPYVPLWRMSSARDLVAADMVRWRDAFEVGRGRDGSALFLRLMVERREFRSLFYHRIRLPRVAQIFLPAMPTLYFATRDIGPGLIIQHGFATIILARSIGRDCWINQQVTIGASNRPGLPEIGDGVIINAGAKILGPIRVGNGARIGANAVVVKDVPPGCTVVGVPARIVRRHGERVDETL